MVEGSWRLGGPPLPLHAPLPWAGAELKNRSMKDPEVGSGLRCVPSTDTYCAQALCRRGTPDFVTEHPSTSSSCPEWRLYPKAAWLRVFRPPLVFEWRCWYFCLN